MAEHRKDARDDLTAKNDEGTSFFWIQESATTKDLPFPGKVLEFDSKVTLGKALHSLADHGVLVSVIIHLPKNIDD